MKLFRLQGYYLLWQNFPTPLSKITYYFVRLLLPPISKDWVWADPRSLATTYGISVDFFSCGYLDGSVPRVRLHNLCIQLWITEHYPCWVSPFGNPGVKNCMRLVQAYRSYPRPSSLPEAKASALHPYSPYQKTVKAFPLIPHYLPRST